MSTSKSGTASHSALGGLLRLGIRNKMILLLMVFGVVPSLAMFGMLIFEEDFIRADLNGRLEASAAQLDDAIDSNLSERYGDVQAFGVNRAAQDRENWGARAPDNPLVRSINSYMTRYRVYKLMLLLDMNGNVVSANTVDGKGAPLDTQRLLGRNFKDAPWFAKAAAGDFLQGRNGLTGTAVEQPTFNPVVADLYGDDGYVIAFSAPVRDSAGNPVAIWVNFADFGLVERIVDGIYQRFAARGSTHTEITILDANGNIIVDYDPKTQGFTDLAGYKRNPDVIGRFNLAEAGVAAAQRAVKGEHGAGVSTHSRKGISQVAGYAHTTGANDFPGLGWSALVRVPTEEVYASVNKLTVAMAIVMGITMVVILFAGALIGNRFARPIIGLTQTMRLLANGDNEVEVPAKERSDEIGDMAGTVEVFKGNAILMKRMEAEKSKSEEEAAAKHKALLNRLADNFENRVGDIVDKVSTQAAEMRQTAENMSSAAEETSHQASSVATAAQQASTNVQAVASATEEMSASVGEINRQVGESVEIANRANSEAERTNQTVKGLAAAADKIGEIVSLISEIAEQTNLLALNATIEAARAGEAGKGFAVVASEVKNLATQTAKATEEIAAQINEMQSVSGQAVTAIASIAKTIDEINGISQTISAAVGEQGTATREISENTQQASSGTQEVSTTIADVTKAATQSGAAAQQVLQAADRLSRQSEGLRREVDQFLENVRESA